MVERVDGVRPLRVPPVREKDPRRVPTVGPDQIRVLVVDDSAVARRLVARVLRSDPEVQIVGFARNGRDAVDAVLRLRPDVVTMDVEMPEMDGIEAVRALTVRGWRGPVIMLSTLTERGAMATLDALAAGAADYVLKPSTSSLEESIGTLAGDLLPRVHALGGPPDAPVAVEEPEPVASESAAASVRQAHNRGRGRPRAVLIGSSTGGPAALAEVVGDLARPLPVPVVVVQHMPPVFTAQLAQRLDKLTPSRVVEVRDGEALEAGTIYVAPGGRHLEVDMGRGLLAARLSDAAPVNYVRPSVDVLFRSGARALGADVLAVVLTGMGADGARGAADVAAAGGTVVAQDRASSVVWGMPRAAVEGGSVTRVLPLTRIAGDIEQSVGRVGG